MQLSALFFGEFQRMQILADRPLWLHLCSILTPDWQAYKIVFEL
jgi:hypothetical protein